MEGGASTRLVGVVLILVSGSGALAACNYSDRDQHMVEVNGQECVLCHRPEYEATTTPPHPGLFPETCGDCHSQDAWVPAIAIRHEWFPLRNRHAELQCTECHTVGFRSGDTPRACEGCHMADYDAATAPPHAGYPTDCARCHDDSGWRPSTFVHSFPLDGAHARTSCFNCHTGDPPRYEGTPTACYDCHSDDYAMATTTVAEHSTYATTCGDCHSTEAWFPATGGSHPNDRFPIRSGHHSGIACADCHNPSLGAITGGMNADCVGCHTHDRARMADAHSDVSGYNGSDPRHDFCRDCHPDGRKN